MNANTPLSERKRIARKAARTRKKNAAKKIKSKHSQTKRGKHGVNWKKAGDNARRTKRRTEGLSNPSGKKEYYDVMKVYAKKKGFSKPTCFCCKNTDWKFLVFDHINKRPESHKGKSGVTMARKLKNDGYLKGIQILCHNCNTGKEIFGGDRCPHYLSNRSQKILKNVNLPLGRILRK